MVTQAGLGVNEALVSVSAAEFVMYRADVPCRARFVGENTPMYRDVPCRARFVGENTPRSEELSLAPYFRYSLSSVG